MEQTTRDMHSAQCTRAPDILSGFRSQDILTDDDTCCQRKQNRHRIVWQKNNYLIIKLMSYDDVTCSTGGVSPHRNIYSYELKSKRQGQPSGKINKNRSGRF